MPHTEFTQRGVALYAVHEAYGGPAALQRFVDAAHDHGASDPGALPDETLAEAYRRAHEAYLAVRAEIGEAAGIAEVGEIADFSAGGMPTRVKCLHALVGHALAAGPGVNPIGDAALERSAWSPARCECAEPGAATRSPAG